MTPAQRAYEFIIAQLNKDSAELERKALEDAIDFIVYRNTNRARNKVMRTLIAHLKEYCCCSTVTCVYCDTIKSAAREMGWEPEERKDGAR